LLKSTTTYCCLQGSADEIFSLQLRLGTNLGRCRTLPDHPERFRRLTETVNHSADTDHLYAFYPRRQPFYLGYVLHVDGLVARRRDLLADLGGFVAACRSPGCLETGWIRRALGRRSRQWQVMYGTSRVVNNALPEDGRVDSATVGGPGSVVLAGRLVEHRLKVDVEAFVDKYLARLDHTHTRLPVEYTDRDPC
jgi:hypothetical protein